MSTHADLDVKSNVGFRPRTVKLRCNGSEAYWQEGMADASMYIREDDGTAELVTSNGITPLAHGFKIGANDDINPASPALITYNVTG